MRIPTHREPTHPGEMLKEEFLNPMGISSHDLADAIYVSHEAVDELIAKSKNITPSTALRLAKFFGLSADYWMNLQARWDLYLIQKSESVALKEIKDFHHLQKRA